MTLPAQSPVTVDELRRLFPHVFVRCPACPLNRPVERDHCLICSARGFCTRAAAAKWLRERGLNPALAAKLPQSTTPVACRRCGGGHRTEACTRDDLDELPRIDACIECGFVQMVDDDDLCSDCREFGDGRL